MTDRLIARPHIPITSGIIALRSMFVRLPSISGLATIATGAHGITVVVGTRGVSIIAEVSIIPGVVTIIAAANDIVTVPANR